ncbi:MAG: 4Fe-4S dicluster domain-containing protein [Ignavibacteria bacterium]|jgi:formate dehydrogenase iron-sulfur subunit|nr:4Fe-4S dicluster domain-containing protein [Ignavibacteria bacterium]MDH7527948.1 4Fe-4S dicluster domain-containing protein [Ignavibacteria bacterium]
MKRKAFLIDITECVGCGACYEACKEQNNLPQTSDDPLRDSLSDKTYTIVEQRGDFFVRRMCQHCEDPTCVSVCPVGAFTKTDVGAVLYDESKCLGCRYCMQACPFQIPRYEWGSVKPRVQKCIMCYDRVKNGELPACAEACPTGATLFGDRDEMIEIAKQRLAENPDKYYQHIYGLEEVGGTSVLYISPVPFEELGFNTKLLKTALPNFTHEALAKIPTLVTVGGVLLTGFYWLTNRKNEIAREKFEEKKKQNLRGEE